MLSELTLLFHHTRERVEQILVLHHHLDDDDVFIKHPGLPYGMLCGYKTNHLSPLLAEVSRVSIIIQTNACFLEGATSGSYAPVVSHFLAP